MDNLQRFEDHKEQEERADAEAHKADAQNKIDKETEPPKPKLNMLGLLSIITAMCPDPEFPISPKKPTK